MTPRPPSLKTLRTLDPVSQQVAAGQLEEEQMHARLLALAIAHPRPTAPPRPARRDSTSVSPVRWAPRSPGRWVTIGAAALAVTIGALVLPSRSDPPAFASWTSVPAAMSVSDVRAVGQQCRDNNVDENRADFPMLPTNADVQRMDTVLAERRGNYTYTLLAGQGWLAECLTGDGLGGGVLAQAGDVDTRTGWSLVPAVDGAVVLTGGTQQTGSTGDPTYRWVTGRVGGEVTGVDVTPTGEGVVTSTVSNGYFAAWWPGGRSDSAQLTLHLADGRIVTGISADDPIISHFEGGPA